MELLTSSEKLQTVFRHLEGAGDVKSDSEMLSFWDNIDVDHKSIWGTKVDIRDLLIVKRYLALKEIPKSEVKWIWLRRRDKVNQAISHCRGLRTGLWHLYGSDSGKKKEWARTDMEIPVEELNQFVIMYFFIDAMWAHFFETCKIEPYTLFYEDFVAECEWGSTVAGVLVFLEFLIHFRLKFPQFRLSNPMILCQ